MLLTHIVRKLGIVVALQLGAVIVISNHSALALAVSLCNQVHQELGLVVAGTHLLHLGARLNGEASASLCSSKVDHSAAHEHDEAVKEVEAVLGGGVDGGADGGAVIHQLLHHSHDLIGGVAVQAAGGLVQEQHARVGHQRNTYVCPLGLSSTDALHEGVADLDVPAPLQSQLLEHLRHLVALHSQGLTGAALELGSVHKHLLHGQDADEGIKLLHIACVTAQELLAGLLATELQIALNDPLVLATSQHIQQGRFAAARGAHQSRHLVGFEPA
mmetsp:Transcript_1499/g.3313  ORF Transcript_1499/g.3313 Transcript_1499/m.3313 type:complete len:273 (-) Transcript_1499:284-1102(-)